MGGILDSKLRLRKLNKDKLAKLRLGFNQQRKQKLGHDFKDKLNLFCSRSIEAETTTIYFLSFL